MFYDLRALICRLEGRTYFSSAFKLKDMPLKIVYDYFAKNKKGVKNAKSKVGHPSNLVEEKSTFGNIHADFEIGGGGDCCT